MVVETELLAEAADPDDGPVLPRPAMRSEADLDMAPMIDITFLLLIFFIVASTPDPQSAVSLPPARYGDGVPEHSCTTITVVDRGGPGRPLVYASDGKIPANLLPDSLEQQEARVLEYVEEGRVEGHTDVLIKAEKGIAWRDVDRVARVAGSLDGINLHIAVYEKD
jgi:biopolymer transport protein ExbD